MAGGTYETKDGSGAIFKTKEKKSENSPDISGNAKLDGRNIRIAGWHKTSAAGTGYYSLKVEWEDESAQAPRNKQDDDVSF